MMHRRLVTSSGIARRCKPHLEPSQSQGNLSYVSQDPECPRNQQARSNSEYNITLKIISKQYSPLSGNHQITKSMSIGIC
jgi:hypothetical protein